MIDSTFFRGLFEEAKQVRREKGTLELLDAFRQFIFKPVYSRYHFYLVENPINLADIENRLAKFKPRIDINRLSFKVVRSNQEAEQLEKEGFEFRSYPYIHEVHLTYNQMLDYGLIAFCTFVDKEFAACSWVITSKQVQDKFKAPPLKVDYANHEGFPRAAWTNPKYRRSGLFEYTAKNRDLYLARNGFKMLRGTIDFRNKVGFDMSIGLGDIICGTATYTKILGWKFACENYGYENVKTKRAYSYARSPLASIVSPSVSTQRHTFLHP
jgi:hypothetical protein